MTHSSDAGSVPFARQDSIGWYDVHMQIARPIDPSGFVDPECLPLALPGDLCCCIEQPEVQAAVIEAASGIAREALTQSWGLCAMTVGPKLCPDCSCTPCACHSLRRIILGDASYPLHSIAEVIVGGANVPLSVLQIRDSVALVRTDGVEWPSGYSEYPPDPLVRAWFGREPNVIIRKAVAEMACLLAQKCPDLCAIPPNTTSLSVNSLTLILDVLGGNGWSFPNLPWWKKMIDLYCTDNMFHAYDPEYGPSYGVVTWSGS